MVYMVYGVLDIIVRLPGRVTRGGLVVWEGITHLERVFSKSRLKPTLAIEVEDDRDDRETN